MHSSAARAPAPRDSEDDQPPTRVEVEGVSSNRRIARSDAITGSPSRKSPTVGADSDRSARLVRPWPEHRGDDGERQEGQPRVGRDRGEGRPEAHGERGERERGQRPDQQHVGVERQRRAQPAADHLVGRERDGARHRQQVAEEAAGRRPRSPRRSPRRPPSRAAMAHEHARRPSPRKTRDSTIAKSGAVLTSSTEAATEVCDRLAIQVAKWSASATPEATSSSRGRAVQASARLRRAGPGRRGDSSSEAIAMR